MLPQTYFYMHSSQTHRMWMPVIASQDAYFWSKLTQPASFRSYWYFLVLLIGVQQSNTSAFLCAHACFNPKCLTLPTKRRVKSGSLSHLELKWLPLHCICIIDKHFVRCCSFRTSAMRNSWGLISRPCMKGRDVTGLVTSEHRIWLVRLAPAKAVKWKSIHSWKQLSCMETVTCRFNTSEGSSLHAGHGTEGFVWLPLPSRHIQGNTFPCLMGNHSLFGL